VRFCAPLILAALVMAGGAKGAPNQPPPPAPSPVTETLFGVRVTDTYRGMEALDPATIDWMKAQGRHTREVLDSIGPRAALLKRISAFSAGFGSVQGVQVFGARTFYLEQPPRAEAFNLMVRDGSGPARTLLDVARLGIEHGGGAYAINYYQASPDGARVGVGVSPGGSEAALLYVYDAATGAQLGGPIDRADKGALSWTDDGAMLFFQRLQKTGDAKAKYLNISDQVWDLKSPPRDVLGTPASAARIPLGPVRRPRVILTPGSNVALAAVQNGVQNELELWTAPATEVSDPAAPWHPLATWSDGVTEISQRGDDIYLLSHKDAPTFQVLHVKAGRPLSTADVVLPARADRLVESIHAALDGLYVQTRQWLYSQLLFIPTGGAAREVTLPAKGSINDLFADPRQPGAVLQFGSWTIPDAFYALGGPDGRFEELKISPRPNYDPAGYQAIDLVAVANDGARVPVTLIAKSGRASGSRTVLMGAYGSYGFSIFPFFDQRAAPFLDEGAASAFCHVRGGGELGEAWRLGGKDANKPNTWRDLIACGEALISQGFTTPDKLFITGGSAGGIAMGRALEEAPALFAGVIDVAPAANPLRSEVMAGGPANVPEFGTIAVEAGFKSLYAMDSVAHVAKGAQYPAVLIATSLNDPRVAPWQGGKLAAALLASGTTKPVLLRVED
jgi:prolyl oligopeptidase